MTLEAGDVTLGAQRLVRGDCFDVLPQLPSGSADMVFCDLPYGVTANKWDCALPLAPLWVELLRVGSPSCVFIFTATMAFASTIIATQRRLYRDDLVYEKTAPTGFLNARKRPLRSHEHILVFCRTAPRYTPQMVAPLAEDLRRPMMKMPTRASETYGAQYKRPPWRSDQPRYPRSIIRFKREKEGSKFSKLHPTLKPVALLEWLVRTYCPEGGLVLDPTSGVATTAVACHASGRRSVCIERDPVYFANGALRLRAALSGRISPPAPRPQTPQSEACPGQQALWAM